MKWLLVKLKGSRHLCVYVCVLLFDLSIWCDVCVDVPW